ncbi:hypothetical protein [Thermicanus aegyptius]|uniref:hypothetical protein n=1 Tax=Thermicanus aegyptius TaxID=94009 RepID=UPI0003FC4520|nr:hypothetical protein [Thermicanus aegyptius]
MRVTCRYVPNGIRSVKSLSFLLCVMIVLGGCAPRVQGENAGDAAVELDRLHRKVLENSFAFDGSASLRKEKFYADNIAMVTGLVQKNRDLYMNIATAPEANGAMEDYDLFTSGRNLYMRFADEVEWKPVANRTPFVDEEIDHWNPLAHFDRMKRLAHRIYYDRKGPGDLSTLVVELDSRLLEQDFLDNVRNRLASKDQRGGTSRLERLSTGNAGDDGVARELQSLKEEASKGLQQIENTLNIDGKYILSYNNKTGLPTRLVYRQQINYTDQGEPNYETSELDMVLRDFGTDEEIPDRIGIKGSGRKE